MSSKKHIRLNTKIQFIVSGRSFLLNHEVLQISVILEPNARITKLSFSRLPVVFWEIDEHIR